MIVTLLNPVVNQIFILVSVTFATVDHTLLLETMSSLDSQDTLS